MRAHLRFALSLTVLSAFRLSLTYACARVCVFGQLSGTFIITAGGVPTAALPYNITSAALQAALSALPAVGNVAVSRSGPDTQLGYVWSITYLALTGNVAEPTVNFAALVGVGKSAALVQVRVHHCARFGTVCTVTRVLPDCLPPHKQAPTMQNLLLLI